MTTINRLLSAAASAVLLATAAGPAFAQDDDGPAITITLNTANPDEGACEVIYELSNNTDIPLDNVVYSFVVLDADGVVQLIQPLNFGFLKAQHTKYVAVDVARDGVAPACDDIFGIVVNDSGGCDRVDDGQDLRAMCRNFDTASRGAITLD